MQIYNDSWVIVWLGGQGLGGRAIRKLVPGRSGEEVCGQTSLNGHRI